MRKSNVMTAILSTASLMCAAGSQVAEAKQRNPASEVILEYYLPEVRIGFAVSHMITACPDENGLGFAMRTVATIKPTYHRGERILINPKGAFPIDREVELQFYKNGTLKSFNASSTGQGGKLVAAAIKAATFVATTAMGLPPLSMGAALAGVASDDLNENKQRLSPLLCAKETIRLLERKKTLEGDLAGLKQSLIRNGASEILAAQIASTEADIALTNSELTLTSNAVSWKPTGAAGDMPPSPDPVDISIWFENANKERLQRALLDAGLGQVLAFKASFGTTIQADGTSAPTTSQKALLYRSPRSIEVRLEPSKAFTPGKLEGSAAARAKAAYDATKVSQTISVPQIGTLKRIPFDGSGIFGSRAVAATFDEDGGLASVGYTSKGGADALAGVVDASVAAAIELRDQETNALKREVERRTQANELEALIEAEAKAQKAKDGAPAAPPAPAPAPAG